jgi:signal transduction histidine kinase
MGWQSTVLSLPIVFAFAASVVILGYSVIVYRDRRDDPLVVLYALMALAAMVWTGFSALKLLQTDPDTKLLFYRLLHVGAAALPPLLFLFVLAFTDRTGWLRPGRVAAVFAVPAAFLLALFFGPSGLVVAGTEVMRGDLVVLRGGTGPGFLVFSLYSTLLVAATIAVVLVETRRVGPAYYPQAALIAVAVFTPMLFSLLTRAEVPPFVDGRVNLMPTAAPVSVVVLGVLLYRYRLVDLPPLAHATAMKYSPDALFVLDADGRVVSTNEHGEELLATVDVATVSSLAEALPDFDPTSASGDLLEMEDAGETTYYRAFTEPLERGGRRLGWVAVLRDETDQQRQQKRLQERNEQMELFASTVSHDLRNPLGVASGYLQLAQKEVDSEKLEEVESAHDRMEEIIEDVLTLARADDRIDDLEPVPMRTAVETAWNNVTTTGAELAVERTRRIMADPAMVQHVFENLFRNAVEHGSTNPPSEAPEDAVEHGSTNPDSQTRQDAVEHGSTGNQPSADAAVEHGSTSSDSHPHRDDAGDGPTGDSTPSRSSAEHGSEGVTVTVGTLENGFYVEDNGSGIPAGERTDVFEVGYTGTEDGTGFGLKIVETVVNAHGWDVRVTAGADGGARFEITGVEPAVAG